MKVSYMHLEIGRNHNDLKPYNNFFHTWRDGTDGDQLLWTWEGLQDTSHTTPCGWNSLQDTLLAVQLPIVIQRWKVSQSTSKMTLLKRKNFKLLLRSRMCCTCTWAVAGRFFIWESTLERASLKYSMSTVMSLSWDFLSKLAMSFIWFFFK